jgi:histone H3/H4
MIKNKLKDNSLIKKNNLIVLMKQHGVNRVDKESINCLENETANFLDKVVLLLKEEMTINGRKTLRKQDVKKAIKKLNHKETFWEI